MSRLVPQRSEERVADEVVVVRGAPVDESSLRSDCARMARRFHLPDGPLAGFSVEAVTAHWPLERLVCEGRVRVRVGYAACTVGELRRRGARLVVAFGADPPHFTVQVDDRVLTAVAVLLTDRVQPNPAWEEKR